MAMMMMMIMKVAMHPTGARGPEVRPAMEIRLAMEVRPAMGTRRMTRMRTTVRKKRRGPVSPVRSAVTVNLKQSGLS